MQTKLSIAIAAGLIAMGGMTAANADNFPGYAEAKGNVVKNSYGECWHVNSTYTDKLAINGCDLSDDDRDGVPNDKDACPKTLPGINVDAIGCNPDSDNDGVRDFMDQCPGTAPGTVVDAKGCGKPAPKVEAPKPAPIDMHVGPVYFAFDSAKLDDIARAVLDANADALASKKVTSVVVTGYTDSVGSADYNQKLSAERAAAVRGYLISRGAVAGDKVYLNSEGEADPAASNDTSAGRAKNRRVTVHGHN